MNVPLNSAWEKEWVLEIKRLQKCIRYHTHSWAAHKSHTKTIRKRPSPHSLLYQKHGHIEGDCGGLCDRAPRFSSLVKELFPQMLECYQKMTVDCQPSLKMASSIATPPTQSSSHPIERWTIRCYKVPGPLPQLRTILKGHPSFKASL